jgi:P4 family phage/plasmid primase-like protien
MSSIDDFHKYLNQYRIKKGQHYTHTSISKIGGPSGLSLNIPNDKLDEFFENYTRAMMRGSPLHLTEKPMDPSLMRIDLDFRFMPIKGADDKSDDGGSFDEASAINKEADDKVIPRMYKDEHVEKILTCYFEILAEFLNVPDETLVAYVMEKPGPVMKAGKIKDGIHVIWPELIVSNNFQHLVRKKILDQADVMLEGLKVCNTYEDIVDQAIIDKNNWQIYGSSKPDCKSYTVTRVYRYNKYTRTLVKGDTPKPEEEMGFVRKFSMRIEREPCLFYTEKEKEFNDFVQHIMPTMDEKRKTKINAQIFASSINPARAVLENTDERELAKRLVAECLSKQRAENYEDWIKLGWTLRNIDYDLLETWANFSRNSEKYMEGECQRCWDKMCSDTIGMGTLRWWARKDNPQQYYHIIHENVLTLIDKCAGSNGAPYDVAEVVYAMYKDRFRHTTKDIWFTYKQEKHRWVRTSQGIILRNILSTKVCQKFMERVAYWNMLQNGAEQNGEAEGKKKQLWRIVLDLKKTAYKSNVMKECECFFTDEKFEDVLDSRPHLIGFENGVYDLRMHEFRDGIPDDYITYSTGRHYIPFNSKSEEAQEIDKFLSQVFTNSVVFKYIKDMFACVLDGSVRQEKFYIFNGKGSNGKSVLLSFLQKAIGDYYCILPIALLTQKRTQSNSAQAEVERTKGRRLTVMQEPGDGEKLNIGLMKELTGGDRILTRGLFKDPIEFRPQFKMIMTCNDLPEVSSDDGGTWRRIRVVQFTSKFTDNPDQKKLNEFRADPELMSKFDRWADTFISMLIDHHKHIDVSNIHEPLDVTKATDMYRSSNDSIGQFVQERMVLDPTSTERVLITKIYAEFKIWANQTLNKSKKIPDRNQYMAYMVNIFGPYPSDNRGWRNIRLLGGEDSDSEAED